MERIINANLIIRISEIKKITIRDEECIVCVATTEYGEVKICFNDVWDCRYTIENGIIDRSTKMRHDEQSRSSIYEVVDSLYIEYFKNQVSGTRPTNRLKNYIIFDDVGTVFEVLTLSEPFLIHD